MSILSRNRPDADESVAPVAAPAKQSGKAAPLSASPRADLLPPEIGEGNKKKAARRGMRLLMFFVLVLALVATAGAFYVEYQAGLAQKKAEDEFTSLQLKKATYADIRATLQGIAEGEAALRVGGSTDIDWSSYIHQLQAILPADVTLTTVSVESADAIKPYEQSDVPLERPRIATIIFAAETATLPSIPSWINALSALPGFADASPQSLNNDEGIFTATIVMHIDTNAYSHRFVLEDEAAAASTDAVATTEGSDP